ncbi:MAG: hypothetical protein U9O87_07915 [Verrucomicrobiota bacterium]|nr:hypothetical protein [Verrucomicrobiota bacterium]
MNLKKTLFASFFIFTFILLESFAESANFQNLIYDKYGVDFHGFTELRLGTRTGTDDHQESESLQDMRLQLEIEKFTDFCTFNLRADFLYDGITGTSDIDLDRATGPVDLREANILFTPVDWMDIKIGRQILTWGTGNMLFINDMFPKDWQAYFSGRDTEYLKAPSDAVFTSIYSSVNLDIAFIPTFDNDRFIDGSRNSFFNENQLVGDDRIIETEIPDRIFTDSETALRLYKNIGGYEIALYYYNGFWKSPAGMNPTNGKMTFPELSVYGMSIRGQVFNGIGNIEIGYYDSENDRDGTDPFKRNSELRYLIGYEREVAKNFTVGLQYYVEHKLDYKNYKQNFPQNKNTLNEMIRQVLTLDLRKQLLNQNLTISCFSYYSPTDNDAYLRPSVSWKATDAWELSAGANIFLGKYEDTFFGQFKNNTNIYISARYGF